MLPTLVNVALGVLLGMALLGAARDRRSLALVAAAAAAPDLDALVPGATNALLHSAFLPAGAALLLYADTRREASWLRGRAGARGVRIAWVAVAAYAVAGIAPDLFNVETAAVLYPLSDRYYAVVGRLSYSTQEGLIQSYVGFADGWPRIARGGTVGSYHIPTWLDPTPGAEPAGVERRLRLVDSGWQFVLVLAAVAAVPAARRLEGD